MSGTRDSAARADVFCQHMLATITSWRENTSANIITLRCGSGMSRRQLAGVLGVATQVVAEYESGEKELSIAHLTRLCSFFDVSVYEFLVRKLTPREAMPRHLGLCLWNLVCAAPDGSPLPTEMLESYCHRTLSVSMPETQEQALIVSITVGELVAPGYAVCAVRLKDAPKPVRGLLGAADHGLMYLTFVSEGREAIHCMLLWQASRVWHGGAAPAMLLDCVAFSPLQPRMTTVLLKLRTRP